MKPKHEDLIAAHGTAQPWDPEGNNGMAAVQQQFRGEQKRRRYKLTDKLPCDVHLPPRTVLRKGCSIATLMIALSQREEYPEENTVFAGRLAPTAGRFVMNEKQFKAGE